VAGVFAPVNETTVKVLGERRLKLMRELGTTVIASQTVAETIKKMKIVFDEQTKDITFTLFYMVEKGVLKLKGSTGFKDQQLNKFLPETVILNNIFFFSLLKIIRFQNLKTISKTKVFNDASKTFIRNIFRDWNWSFKKT